MTAFERVRRALEDRGEVKVRGDQLTARCPAHEDHNPSLSVRRIDGQVLVHCFAGCDTAAVVAALGLTMRDLFDDPRGVTYCYDNGRAVHRSPDKQFRQRNTDRQPELYRLAQVKAAVAAGEPVFVCEGEKDVHAAESLGLTATCNPMGAGKWAKIDPTPLYGATVLIIADNDEPGRKHAAEVAASLTGHATVTVLQAAEGKDLADHIAAAHGVDDLVPVVLPEPGASTCEVSGPGSTASRNESAASVLVRLALDAYTLGVSQDGEPFAVSITGPRIARPFRGGAAGLRAELASSYRRATGKIAPKQAIADALLTLEGDAANAEPQQLALRVAEQDGAYFLDLGDRTGRAARVDATGWRIDEDPPVLFRRTVLTAELPEPTRDGKLDLLWRLLNVAALDRPLVAAWLVAALSPGIPHPIAALLGEQGTGKTTAAKILSSVIDPSPVPVRKAPRDAETWVTAASGSWAVGLDNLSAIPEWLSDTLCRAVTGDGDVRRELFSDSGLVVFAFRRCVILTGIDIGALRGDLADRLLLLELERIHDSERRPESELWPAFQRAQPAITGAVLDLAASVASVLPSVRLDGTPRMVDFARIVAAVDKVLGTNGLARYTDRAATLAADSLAADPYIAALARALAEPFAGTSADLMALTPSPDRPPKEWPVSARAVTSLLTRQGPLMRRAGWTVDRLPTGHDNAVRWAIAAPDQSSDRHSHHSRPAPDPDDHNDHAAGTDRGGGSETNVSAAPIAAAFATGPSGPGREAGPKETHQTDHAPCDRAPAGTENRAHPAGVAPPRDECAYCTRPALLGSRWCGIDDDGHRSARRALGEPIASGPG